MITHISRIAVTLCIIAIPASGQSPLCTIKPFAQNNGGSIGGAIFFDLEVYRALRISALDVNYGATAGKSVGVTVYTTPGTFAGKEKSAAAWTQVAVDNGAGVAAGIDNITSLTLATPFDLARGCVGVCLVAKNTKHAYTNGNTNGSNQEFHTAELSISLGAAQNTPWISSPFHPRIWNGCIHYTPLRRSLCTINPFGATYSTAVGGAVFFDLNVHRALRITALDVNYNAAAGSQVGVEVYTTPGTYLGNERTAAAWTQVAVDDGTGTAAGRNNVTSLTLASSFGLALGPVGVCLVAKGSSHAYTTGAGTNQQFNNSELSIALGAVQSTPWMSGVSHSRVWNGCIHYEGGAGSFLGTFPSPSAGTPMGLANAGGGYLLFSDAGGVASPSLIGKHDRAGNIVFGWDVSQHTGSALSITTDGSYYYVVDGGAAWDEIDVYDHLGTYIRSFIASFSAINARGIAYSSASNHLFVIGSGTNQCLEFDLSGSLIGSYPLNGTTPRGIDYDGATDTFWVYDAGSDSIRNYDATFTELSRFAGITCGSLGEGLAYSHGVVYVCVPGSASISAFDAKGTLASVIAYGAGCGPSSGPDVTLSTTGVPVTGAVVQFQTDDIPVGTLSSVLRVGVSSLAIDLNFIGMPRCTLLVGTKLFSLPVDPTGKSALEIPRFAGLVGLSLFGQSVTVSPGVNPLGVAASNGLKLDIGGF